MCDGNNNVIKSQFPPHAIMRTGQDPIILMGWRNWRNYITFTETGRPYMYFWPANFQQNILPPALSGAQFLLSITKPRQLWTHRPPRGAEEETRKKGFRHDYEIQSVRLKWPIAANYRRLNHFSPPPLLLPVIYPYIYMYTVVFTNVCWFFYHQYPTWLADKTRANELLRNFCFSRRWAPQFKVKLPNYLYAARAHHLTVCSQRCIIISTRYHENGRQLITSSFFGRGIFLRRNLAPPPSPRWFPMGC